MKRLFLIIHMFLYFNKPKESSDIQQYRKDAISRGSQNVSFINKCNKNIANTIIGYYIMQHYCLFHVFNISPESRGHHPKHIISRVNILIVMVDLICEAVPGQNNAACYASLITIITTSWPPQALILPIFIILSSKTEQDDNMGICSYYWINDKAVCMSDIRRWW